MVKNIDKKIGMWLENIPYLWIGGKSLETCYRFYLLHLNSCVVYDKKGYAIDPAIIVDKITINKIKPSETFSIFPIVGDGCNTSRNLFLVYMFNDLIGVNTLDKVITQPIKNMFPNSTITVRIEGKKAQPNRYLIKNTIVNVLSKNKEHRWEKVVLPREFGNKRSLENGPYEPMLYKNQQYRNIYDAVKKLDLGKYDIYEIHNLALDEEEGWSYINKDPDARQRQETLYIISMGDIKVPLVKTDEGIVKYEWASPKRMLGERVRSPVAAKDRKMMIVGEL